MTTEQIVKERSKTIVFVLDTRSKSSVTRKRTDGKQDHLDTAITFSIPITGREPRHDGGALLRTMYIPGAPTRFIDDYTDKDGKVVKGLKSLGYDKEMLAEGKKQALRRNVHFKWGKLVLNTFGDNAGLVDYLMNHEFCADSPHFKQMNSINKGGIIKWHIEKAEQEAEDKLEGLTIDLQITELLANLAKKQGKSYQYDTQKIDALLTMFAIGGGIPQAEYARKVLAITSFAKENPVKFLHHYNSQTAVYRTNIAHAIEMNVLLLKDNKAIFSEGKKEIYEFKTKVKDEQYDELVMHFLTHAGGKDYNAMTILTDAATKLKALK